MIESFFLVDAEGDLHHLARDARLLCSLIVNTVHASGAFGCVHEGKRNKKRPSALRRKGRDCREL